jgi:hypothetical protein
MYCSSKPHCFLIILMNTHRFSSCYNSSFILSPNFTPKNRQGKGGAGHQENRVSGDWLIGELGKAPGTGPGAKR